MALPAVVTPHLIAQLNAGEVRCASRAPPHCVAALTAALPPNVSAAWHR
jgi:hypothetical protein